MGIRICATDRREGPETDAEDSENGCERTPAPMLDQWVLCSVDVEDDFAREIVVQLQLQLLAFFLSQKFVPASAMLSVFDAFPDRKRAMPKGGEFTRQVPW